MTATVKVRGWWAMSVSEILGESRWIGDGYYFDNFRPSPQFLEIVLTKLALLTLVRCAGEGVRFEDDEWLVAELLNGAEYLAPFIMDDVAGWLDMVFMADVSKCGAERDRARVLYCFRRIINRNRTKLTWNGKPLA